MTLSEVSIQRPVLTIVISLFILLAGAISLLQLPVREYPAVDPPTVSITTSYPGAAAEVMQTQVTERIEEAVNTVAGIDTLSSVSREGASVITTETGIANTGIKVVRHSRKNANTTSTTRTNAIKMVSATSISDRRT